MNPRRILSQIALVAGAILFSIGLQAFAAFTQPTTSPPNSDAYAPLDTGPTAQAKTGGLLLNTGGATNGLIVQSGNVGIGTTSPSHALDVEGYINGSTGLCIGGNCITSWPTATAVTKSPTVYNCPVMKTCGNIGQGCNGQLSTNSSCDAYSSGGCNTYKCSFAGYLVQ